MHGRAYLLLPHESLTSPFSVRPCTYFGHLCIAVRSSISSARIWRCTVGTPCDAPTRDDYGSVSLHDTDDCSGAADVEMDSSGVVAVGSLGAAPAVTAAMSLTAAVASSFLPRVTVEALAKSGDVKVQVRHPHSAGTSPSLLPAHHILGEQNH